MLRYRQACWISRLDHDDVAAMLPVSNPSRLLESPNGSLPGNRGQHSHQTGTSISRTSMVRGIPLADRASRQPAIASRMFSRASASVLPCDMHPGIAGHSATIIPVSSGSNVTRSFIIGSYRPRAANRGPHFPRPDHFFAQIRPQRLGDHHAAILLLVVLDDRHPGAADRQAAAVQGVDELRLLAGLEADARPPRLESLEVGAGGDFLEPILPGQPDFEVVRLGRGEAQIAGQSTTVR